MLHFYTFLIFLATFTPVKPSKVTVKDILKKLSTHETIAMFGKKALIDSSSKIADSPQLEWHERMMDSLRGLGTPKFTFTQMAFGPVLFEGESAKVTILFAGDSSFGATVSIPYPARLGKPATETDFTALNANIAKSIGDPSIVTANYIDYLAQGHQSLFGELRDGKITITAWRMGN